MEIHPEMLHLVVSILHQFPQRIVEREIPFSHPVQYLAERSQLRDHFPAHSLGLIRCEIIAGHDSLRPKG